MRPARGTLRFNAALVAPVLLVMGVRMILQTGPAVSFAEPAPAPDDGPPTPASPRPRPALSDADRALLAWEAAQVEVPARGSPMAPGRIPVPAPPEPQEAPAAPATPNEEPARPALKLSAVMGSGDNAIAVIDGRMRRVGDAVAPGYVIRRIESRAGIVTIAGPGGITRTLAVRE